MTFTWCLSTVLSARIPSRSSHHTLADLLRGWLAASSAQARYGGDADAAARAANAALRQLRLELPELPELVRLLGVVCGDGWRVGIESRVESGVWVWWSLGSGVEREWGFDVMGDLEVGSVESEGFQKHAWEIHGYACKTCERNYQAANIALDTLLSNILICKALENPDMMA